jgi:hypothetical protein
MFEGMNYQKEKRKKRLTQNNRKKIAADHKLEKSKKRIKLPFYENRYLESWELINSR